MDETLTVAVSVPVVSVATELGSPVTPNVKTYPQAGDYTAKV